MSKYYIALNQNPYQWTVFLSYPEEATAEATGFVAVGAGYPTAEKAKAQARLLNYAMFRIENYPPAGVKPRSDE